MLNCWFGAVSLSDRRQGWPPQSVRSDGHGEFGEHGGESVLLGCIGGDLILAAARVLHEPVPSGDDLGGAVSFESAHGSEPGFEPAMVTFDRVVRVLLGGVHRRRDQLVQGPRVHRCPVGGDLDRDGASAQRSGEEPSRCGKVAVRGEQHIDELTVLVDRPVQIGSTAGNL